MTIQPLTGILMAVEFFSVLIVMIGWHVLTRGSWRHWAAGVSLMGLLATIAAITALASVSSFFPMFPGRALAYIILYSLLIVTTWLIGWAIYRAQRGRNPKGTK